MTSCFRDEFNLKKTANSIKKSYRTRKRKQRHSLLFSLILVSVVRIHRLPSPHIKRVRARKQLMALLYYDNSTLTLVLQRHTQTPFAVCSLTFMAIRWLCFPFIRVSFFLCYNNFCLIWHQTESNECKRVKATKTCVP